MRNLTLITILLASMMVLISCETKDELTNASLIKKSWTRSYEEENSKESEIYRPSDYKDFGISRYRQIFNFEDKNVCNYLVLAPDDGHYMESGSWEYNDITNIIKIFNSNSVVLHEFEVVLISHDLLKLKAIN